MKYDEGPTDAFVTPCCGVRVNRPVYPVQCKCPPPRGLGEVIHAIAKLIAPKKAKECVPCNKRRAMLNGITPQQHDQQPPS